MLDFKEVIAETLLVEKGIFEPASAEDVRDRDKKSILLKMQNAERVSPTRAGQYMGRDVIRFLKSILPTKGIKGIDLSASQFNYIPNKVFVKSFAHLPVANATAEYYKTTFNSQEALIFSIAEPRGSKEYSMFFWPIVGKDLSNENFGCLLQETLVVEKDIFKSVTPKDVKARRQARVISDVGTIKLNDVVQYKETHGSTSYSYVMKVVSDPKPSEGGVVAKVKFLSVNNGLRLFGWDVIDLDRGSAKVGDVKGYEFLQRYADDEYYRKY